MTVQFNCDISNQHQLFTLLERLREIGFVKSFYIFEKGNHAPKRTWRDFFIKKDFLGVLSQIPARDWDELVRQARARIAPYYIETIQEEQEAMTSAFAALLYERSLLSAGKAAAFADMSKADFIRQMGQYQVSSFGETVEEIYDLGVPQSDVVASV